MIAPLLVLYFESEVTFEMGTLNNNMNRLMNVCRLCSGTNSLISIFDDRVKIPNNMTDVIQVTTGVRISPSDNVSQMLCYKCVEMTITMFKFRSNSIVNDLELKQQANKKTTDLNDSIQSLLNQYPKLVLPPSLTEVNVAPTVSINKDEVGVWMNKYRKKRKLEKKRRKELKIKEEEKKVNRKIILHINSRTGEVLSKEQVVSNDQMELPEKKLESVSVQPNVSVNEDVDFNQNSPNAACRKGNSSLNSAYNDSPTLSPLRNKTKRKLCLSLSKPEAKKMRMNSDLNDTDVPVNTLSDAENVSESIYVCDICHSNLFNSKDLERHRTEHITCTLCDKKFQSVEETKDHSETQCNIKLIMDNLPKIFLKRCDEIDDIRKRYHAAFGVSSNEDSSLQQTSQIEKNVLESCEEEIEVALPAEEDHQVVLISDDEDFKSGSDSEITKPSSTKSSNSKEAEKSIIPPKIIIPTSFKNLEKKIKTNGLPNLKIVGDNILDLNLANDEVSLLKHIWKRTADNTKDSSIQSDFPDSADIVPILEKNKLFKLGNTKKYLDFHKIPINISYANQYSVRYGHDASMPLLKKDSTWTVVRSQGNLGKNIERVDSATQSGLKGSNSEARNNEPSSILSPDTLTTTSNSVSKLSAVAIQESSAAPASFTKPHSSTKTIPQKTSITSSSNTELSNQTVSNSHCLTVSELTQKSKSSAPSSDTQPSASRPPMIFISTSHSSRNLFPHPVQKASITPSSNKELSDKTISNAVSELSLATIQKTTSSAPTSHTQPFVTTSTSPMIFITAPHSRNLIPHFVQKASITPSSNKGLSNQTISTSVSKPSTQETSTAAASHTQSSSSMTKSPMIFITTSHSSTNLIPHNVQNSSITPSSNMELSTKTITNSASELSPAAIQKTSTASTLHTQPSATMSATSMILTTTLHSTTNPILSNVQKSISELSPATIQKTTSSAPTSHTLPSSSMTNSAMILITAPHSTSLIPHNVQKSSITPNSNTQTHTNKTIANSTNINSSISTTTPNFKNVPLPNGVNIQRNFNNNNANNMAASLRTSSIQSNVNATLQNSSNTHKFAKPGIGYSAAIKTHNGTSNTISTCNSTLSGLTVANNTPRMVISENAVLLKRNNSQLGKSNNIVLADAKYGFQNNSTASFPQSSLNRWVVPSKTVTLKSNGYNTHNYINGQAASNRSNHIPNQVPQNITNNNMQQKSNGAISNFDDRRLQASQNNIVLGKINGNKTPVSTVSTTESNNNSISVQVNDSVVPSKPLGVHNSVSSLFLPPQPINKHNQKCDKDSTFDYSSRETNENGTQTMHTTTASSLPNGNSNFVPLIRVKSISELR